MCGITGYVGSRAAADVLIDGLRRLEYRGYDSCGIALAQKNGKLYLNRVSGRVELLARQVKERPPQESLAGIGHTRWATHGAPSEENAHPHTDCTGELVVVHNGIIENYLALKESLIENGHAFKSETDTETIVHLIEKELKKACGGNFSKNASAEMMEKCFFEAFRNALKQLQGSFAVSAVWSRMPDMILSARMHSPLVIGKGEDGNCHVVGIGLGDVFHLIIIGEAVEILPGVGEHHTRQGYKPRQLEPHQQQGQESKAAVDGVVLRDIDLSREK